MLLRIIKPLDRHYFLISVTTFSTLVSALEMAVLTLVALFRKINAPAIKPRTNEAIIEIIMLFSGRRWFISPTPCSNVCHSSCLVSVRIYAPLGKNANIFNWTIYHSNNIFVVHKHNCFSSSNRVRKRTNTCWRRYWFWNCLNRYRIRIWCRVRHKLY